MRATAAPTASPERRDKGAALADAGRAASASQATYRVGRHRALRAGAGTAAVLARLPQIDIEHQLDERLRDPS